MPTSAKYLFNEEMAVGESTYAAVAEGEEPSAVCDSSKSKIATG